MEKMWVVESHFKANTKDVWNYIGCFETEEEAKEKTDALNKGSFSLDYRYRLEE